MLCTLRVCKGEPFLNELYMYRGAPDSVSGRMIQLDSGKIAPSGIRLDN